MIVVDSSALPAILLFEPERQGFRDILSGGQSCAMSAVNAREAACVLRVRVGQAAVEDLWNLLEDNEIEMPFDRVQVRVAAEAYHRYGNGIDPKARLNLGDCAAYALAKTMDTPLLFKGDDFTHTDVEPIVLGHRDQALIAPIRLLSRPTAPKILFSRR